MLHDEFNIIDLTHSLTESVPTWTGSCGFCLEIKRDYDQVFRVNQVKMHAGVGTHMDAPSHRFEGGHSIADIALEHLIVPVCVIDVSTKADADYEISLEDLEEYEKKYGKTPKNSLVIGYTGWERFWKSPEQYRNVDEKGLMHFPAFSESVGEVLLQREIAGIAIDTLSPDSPKSSFPIHKLFLGAGKYIIENVANASQIPPKGAIIIALPIKAVNATESPIRLVALVPK